MLKNRVYATKPTDINYLKERIITVPMEMCERAMTCGPMEDFTNALKIKEYRSKECIRSILTCVDNVLLIKLLK